jgi:hypothetical protein
MAVLRNGVGMINKIDKAGERIRVSAQFVEDFEQP